MPELTVEVKATELDVVKEMVEELTFLRYFYNGVNYHYQSIGAMFSEEYKLVSSKSLPKGYQ